MFNILGFYIQMHRKNNWYENTDSTVITLKLVIETTKIEFLKFEES